MEDLIIRSLQGRITQDEKERLRRWREEAPENQERYEAAAAIWSLSGAATPKMTFGPPPDFDALADQAEARERAPGAHRVGARGIAPGRTWARSVAAGALAASLVAVGFGLSVLLEDDDPAGLFSESRIVTGSGEMTTLTLGDGSNIRLGPRSTLELSHDDDGVVARLTGRAFFGVERAGVRKFRVITASGEAEVLGTRFEVRSEDDEFRVLVVDGKVQVSAGGEALDLTTEQMGRSASGGPLVASDVQDVFRHLDWMGNSLVFQGTRLDRAISEIERRFGVSVILDAQELAHHTVTVTFTAEEVESIVMVLCETVGADCSVEDDQFRIRSARTRS